MLRYHNNLGPDSYGTNRFLMVHLPPDSVEVEGDIDPEDGVCVLLLLLGDAHDVTITAAGQIPTQLSPAGLEEPNASR